MVNKKIKGLHRFVMNDGPHVFSFVEYIFDNDEITAGRQRYDMILDDIKPYMKDGYSLYVTGHRYVSLSILKMDALHSHLKPSTAALVQHSHR